MCWNSPSSASTVWQLEAIFGKRHRNISTDSQSLWFLKRWEHLPFRVHEKPLAHSEKIASLLKYRDTSGKQAERWTWGANFSDLFSVILENCSSTKMYATLPFSLYWYSEYFKKLFFSHSYFLNRKCNCFPFVIKRQSKGWFFSHEISQDKLPRKVCTEKSYIGLRLPSLERPPSKAGPCLVFGKLASKQGSTLI